VITARLADVLVVQAVRSWLESDAPDRGWVAAIRDDAVGAALRAFHEEPSEPWGLDALARTAGLSRSAFCARFTHLMGEPPITYTTAWRMDLAARLVVDGAPLSQVAQQVGYRSEAAFNRAFKRAHGVTPGRFARRDRSFLEHVAVAG
jgi:AraC-like DNA-binding protein